MKIDFNTIYNMDCLQGMQHIPDGSVDMILCDLPYGTTACKWDVVIPFAPLWEQYLRVIKQNGAIVLTAQQPFATDLINSCRACFRYEIIWEKTTKVGFPNANKMPLRGHENILVFYKKMPTYNPQKYTVERKDIGRTKRKRGDKIGVYNQVRPCEYTEDGTRFPHSVIKISNWNGALFGRKNPDQFHPTQKPVELFAWLIKTYTNEGDVVLDNCMGSGTTAIACMQNNRRYIGFELDAEYCKKALQRIENYKNNGCTPVLPTKQQATLFD